MSPDKRPRLWSTKEGVGETSGQTAGSNFGKIVLSKEVRLSKPVRQKKRVLLRSVRVSLTTRNFYRAERPGMKSGPDVFADALVPLGRTCSRNVSFPERIWSETYRFDGRASRPLAPQSSPIPLPRA